MKKSFLFGILIVLCHGLKAQETFAPPITSPQVKAKSTQLTMRIDGILDEADWFMAESIHAFVQKDPVQGNAASMPTEVKILFDQENLYVGAYCRVPGGRKDIRAQNLQRDFDYGSIMIPSC